MEMNAFAWGVVVGGIAGPFVVELVKWGWRKFKEKTGS